MSSDSFLSLPSELWLMILKCGCDLEWAETSPQYCSGQGPERRHGLHRRKLFAFTMSCVSKYMKELVDNDMRLWVTTVEFNLAQLQNANVSSSAGERFEFQEYL